MISYITDYYPIKLQHFLLNFIILCNIMKMTRVSLCHFFVNFSWYPIVIMACSVECIIATGYFLHVEVHILPVSHFHYSGCGSDKNEGINIFNVIMMYDKLMKIRTKILQEDRPLMNNSNSIPHFIWSHFAAELSINISFSCIEKLKLKTCITNLTK